eukprot:2157949-Ditylum_brightwellii.AAC.1
MYICTDSSFPLVWGSQPFTFKTYWSVETRCPGIKLSTFKAPGLISVVCLAQELFFAPLPTWHKAQSNPERPQQCALLVVGVGMTGGWPPLPFLMRAWIHARKKCPSLQCQCNSSFSVL